MAQLSADTTVITKPSFAKFVKVQGQRTRMTTSDKRSAFRKRVVELYV